MQPALQWRTMQVAKYSGSAFFCNSCAWWYHHETCHLPCFRNHNNALRLWSFGSSAIRQYLYTKFIQSRHDHSIIASVTCEWYTIVGTCLSLLNVGLSSWHVAQYLLSNLRSPRDYVVRSSVRSSVRPSRLWYVLDRQLLNGWSHRHQNRRLCSRPHSNESVIFLNFWDSYFSSYGELVNLV